MTGRSLWAGRLTRVLLLAVVLGASGCAVAQDDELAPRPTRTVTVTPTPDAAVPRSVPVGRGAVSPDDVVWAQGTSLHVGDRVVDLSPVQTESLAVVAGGVYLLDDGRLWLTDLARVRDTGLTDVTGLAVTADRARLLVTRAERAGAATYAFTVRTGRRAPSAGAVAGDPRGTPLNVDLAADRVTVRTDGKGTRSGWRGPGGFGLALTAGGAPVAFDASTGDRIRLAGTVPKSFALSGWAGPERFYGLSHERAGRTAVVACDVAAATCRRLGGNSARGAVVFASQG